MVIPVIASEAKQSIALGKGRMDCFVASLPCANASRLSQAMTVDRYDFSFSRRDAPGVLHFVVPPGNQRAQGKPGTRCTRGLMCDVHQKCCT
jgi:hypothetical protein